MTEPNISGYRRQTFGDLTSAFRFGLTTPTPAVVPSASASELTLAVARTSKLALPTFPGADQTVPIQQAGTRPKVG